MRLLKGITNNRISCVLTVLTKTKPFFLPVTCLFTNLNNQSEKTHIFGRLYYNLNVLLLLIFLYHGKIKKFIFGKVLKSKKTNNRFQHFRTPTFTE